MKNIEISATEYESLRHSVINAGAIAGLLLLALGSGNVMPVHRHAVKTLRDDCQRAERIIADLMAN